MSDNSFVALQILTDNLLYIKYKSFRFQIPVQISDVILFSDAIFGR